MLGDGCLTTKEIRNFCKSRGIREKNIIALLRRKKAIEPLLFKGIFYIRSEKEMLNNTTNESITTLIAMACNKKLGKNWYFGLETALGILGVSRTQTESKICIITKRQVIPSKKIFKGIEIVFLRIKGTSEAGIIQKGEIRYSDIFRTALDFMHLSIKSKGTEYAKLILREIINKTKGKFQKQTNKIIGEYSTKKSILKIIESELQ